MNQKDNISNFIEFKKSREERNNTHVIHMDFKFHRNEWNFPLFWSSTAGMNSQEFKIIMPALFPLCQAGIDIDT